MWGNLLFQEESMRPFSGCKIGAKKSYKQSRFYLQIISFFNYTESQRLTHSIGQRPTDMITYKNKPVIMW